MVMGFGSCPFECGTRTNSESAHDLDFPGAAVDDMGKRDYAALLSSRPTGSFRATPPPRLLHHIPGRQPLAHRSRPGVEGFSHAVQRSSPELHSRRRFGACSAGIGTGHLLGKQAGIGSACAPIRCIVRGSHGVISVRTDPNHNGCGPASVPTRFRLSDWWRLV